MVSYPSGGRETPSNMVGTSDVHKFIPEIDEEPRDKATNMNPKSTPCSINVASLLTSK